ncbi:MAG: 50S ribosomal protein L1 [Anaerolineales bacterium]|jgi:large subunit ribosomal protein L1|nr:50S ribosomal protein L1 [Anaerolineales bacterium]
MAKHGKKYRQAVAQVEIDKLYEPLQALTLARETSYTKFDGTIEVHIRLGVDPRHAEQQVRDTVQLPNGLGKAVRVIAFTEGEGTRVAQEAGADIIGDDAMILKIKDGWLEFDAAVATPEMMGKIGKSGLGKVLGPRGLMPNPKAGTVVPAVDLPRVIKELKAGRVEFRVDKTANLHVPIGKASFSADNLTENFTALMDAVKKARPPAAKGTYIRKITVTSTMGPGIKIDPNIA